MIGIIGPTASGKTSLAVAIADKIGGEIISADSRQVYVGMDIGSGKDLREFEIDKRKIPYHLIDIKDPGYEYNVYEYQQDFYKAYNDIVDRKKTPVLCGGTGLYIESILKGYKLIQVPRNEQLREQLENKEDDELIALLSAYKELHNSSDSSDRNRLIRAIEIALYTKENRIVEEKYPEIDYHLFAIHFERAELKKRITKRLRERLDEGMVEEVEGLLKKGISADQLKFYGLEYKFLAQYVIGELNYNDMYQKLNAAIHQFAKRQMTWYRRMERNGITIHWIPGNIPLEKKRDIILRKIAS
jgi:tRNA dimethylallyltransferase